MGEKVQEWEKSRWKVGLWVDGRWDITGSFARFKPPSEDSVEYPEAAPVCLDLGYLQTWPE